MVSDHSLGLKTPAFESDQGSRAENPLGLVRDKVKVVDWPPFSDDAHEFRQTANENVPFWVDRPEGLHLIDHERSSALLSDPRLHSTDKLSDKTQGPWIPHEPDQ